MFIVLLAIVSTSVLADVPSNFVESDVLVPEMMQLPDQMDALRTQFEQLRTQVTSGMQVTPGVEATVDRMVTMVEGSIEPAIKTAHDADQTTLNTDMGAIRMHNHAFAEQEKLLQQQADNVRKLVDDEQAKSKTWEAQATKFTNSQNGFLSAYKTQTETCCERDRVAVMSVEYVPAYAVCDYKQQDASGGVR